VRVSDGTLLQEGLVDDPSCDYTHPSLAVDGDGNIGLGCTRTSTNEYPSVYIMMHGVGDPPGTTRPPVKAVPGTTYFRYAKYNAIPWGNYSATCIDPSDPHRLWTYQEYANSTNDGEWCTAWASFRFDPLPRPGLTDPRLRQGACLLDATGLVSGVSYLVQSSTDLLSATWLTASVFTAPAPSTTLTNFAGNSAQTFYRVAQ
jgi:hypothetical protein